MIEKKDNLSETLIGPYQKHCDGYSNKGGNAYLCAITLHTHISERRMTPTKYIDISKLYELNAFDLAEAMEAYLGQINMITASSFSGPMGFIWGLDLVTHDQIKGNKELLIIGDLNLQRHDGEDVKVYDGSPLLESSKLLFGTIETDRDLHFPPMPGAHIPCVNAFYYSKPNERCVFCGVGIGIPSDPENDATLFMQFASGSEKSVEERLMKKEIERALAESIIEVGKNQHILYKEIYVCSNLKRVPSGKFGAAFSAVPYVVLPKDAVPEGDVTKLRTYTLSGWLDRVEDKFVSCRCEVSTRGR